MLKICKIHVLYNKAHQPCLEITGIMRRKYSIIIPVLNEKEIIGGTIRRVSEIINKDIDEMIIADGDPGGSTINHLPSAMPLKVITAEKGRARQMNAGAGRAGGEVLVFLHADTRLPRDALEYIDGALYDHKVVGGAFDLGFDDSHWWFSIIAASGSMRSRLTRIPFGDQAHFFRRDYFYTIGGYPEIPIMEDVEIMRKVKQRGDTIKILDSRVNTSPRMWYENGFLINTLKNYAVQLMYLMGMPVGKLAKIYYRGNGRQ